MKKIGIISELNLNNTNYGNRLQAFALNYYLNNNYKEYQAYSLYFNIYDIKKNTKLYPTLIIKKIIKKIIKLENKDSNFEIKQRMENCNNFTIKNTKLCDSIMTWSSLQNSDYDVFITGSDVVWAQFKGGINRIRFLNFTNKKNFEKISYAPSFGRDWIPNENIKKIKKMLSSFKAISVREKSSVKMLNDIGIKNVEHVCDPTLLLTAEEWEKKEEKVKIDDKFIFVYLLGKSKLQRDKIKKIANENNLKIVSIPHANEKYSDIDEEFGNYKIKDCSPEQWIWLIHNAEYVITDSFHGAVFSTIFNKKFIITKREYTEDINNRMIDYLSTIDENNKFIDITKIVDINKLNWDYNKINRKIKEFREKSIDYLNKSLKN